MKILALILVAIVVLSTAEFALAQSKPDEVVFPSDGRQLHGFLWKPEGTGPFRAIVWNHGSEKLPGSQPTLANFYTAHSYVFFVPHRRGQGRSRATISRIKSHSRLRGNVIDAWSNFSRPRLTTSWPP
jgi:carboxymethylenebutenolidase